MSRKVDFLAVIPEEKKDKTTFQAYFFCKQTKQLLAIEVSVVLVEALIKKEHTGLTSLRAFFENFNKQKIKRIVISKGRADNSYRAIIKARKFIVPRKIITSFFSGFLTARLLNIPLEIESSVLKREGIYVTRELLEASLLCGK
ncbi:hypothetical protein GF360_01760 [candidate division WWE3 bacterium]|nr:hypothetical protein [candidate division WWE3 bacterium]